jgi:hypothetical protein
MIIPFLDLIGSANPKTKDKVLLRLMSREVNSVSRLPSLLFMGLNQTRLQRKIKKKKVE